MPDGICSKERFVILKDAKYFSAKAVSVFIMLFSIVMDAKPFFPAIPCCKFRFTAGILHDHGSRILWCVGVQHVDRDSLLTEWEDGVLMKDGSSHVGKLTQLTVGNGGMTSGSLTIRGSVTRKPETSVQFS